MIIAVLLGDEHDAGAIRADLAQRLADLGGVEAHPDDSIRARIDCHGDHLLNGILTGTGERGLIVRDRNSLLLTGAALWLDSVTRDDSDHITDNGGDTPPRDLTQGDGRDGAVNRPPSLLPWRSLPVVVWQSLSGILRRGLPDRMHSCLLSRPDLLVARQMARRCLPATLPFRIGGDVGRLGLERVGSRRVGLPGIGLGPADRLMLVAHPTRRLLGLMRVLRVRSGSIASLPVAAHARQF